jgi:transcription termination factor Rho
VLETTPKASVLAGVHRIEKLTIGRGGAEFVATALIDTGSCMDEVIFEECKGTGAGNLCEGTARG